VDDFQGALPACIGEEMERYVSHPRDFVGNPVLVVLVIGRFERPIVKQRSADDVFARHKPPVARIEAVVAVIAHHEVLARGNDQIAVDHIFGKLHKPGLGRGIGLIDRWRDGGKLVEEVLMIERGNGLGIGLALGHSVDDRNAVAEMNVISGNAVEPG